MRMMVFQSARLGRLLRCLLDEQTAAGYTFLLPALMYFAIFVVFPLGYAFYLSFTSWNMIQQRPTPIGLQNYQQLFADHQIAR